MEQDSLLNQALNECKSLHQSGKISWYSNLTNILNCFNIDNDISELSNLKSELKKQYEEFWKINIKRSSKLHTYSSFESSFCAESYLFTIKMKIIEKVYKWVTVKCISYTVKLEQETNDH